MPKYAIGIFSNVSVDLRKQVELCLQNQFDFLATPLIPPRCKSFNPFCDLIFVTEDWRKLIATYIYCDEFEEINKNGTYPLISTLLSYSEHLNIQTVILECPMTTEGIVALASCVNSMLQYEGFNFPRYLLHIPIDSSFYKSQVWHRDTSAIPSPEGIIVDPWQQWNLFRSLCVLDKRIGVALEISGDLPLKEEQKRWFGEPVNMVILPTSSFSTNKKNFPVVDFFYKEFVQGFLMRNPKEFKFLVSGVKRHESYRSYSQYLQHFADVEYSKYKDICADFIGYEDRLQLPLQPLMDNLDSGSYEIFEKDPVKYHEYQRSLVEAMKSFDVQSPIVILVVGAGRGPLIKASLKAACITEKKVIIYAIEKNPYAYITLENENWIDAKETGSEVIVVKSDIRDWKIEDLADIVVSELLGSFSDNELSPECLDGVWRCVKENAISIPETYQSFLHPIMTHSIYSDAHFQREKDKPYYHRFERCFVVKLRNYYSIDDPQPLFKFEHKDLTKNPSTRNNNRYCQLTFKAKLDCVCHGFAGYFDVKLFGNITLSTVPGNHSENLISWFPFYIPLSNPIQIKAGQNIKVHLWRVVGKKAVWYEWCLSEPTITPIQNFCGRSTSIGLY